jgi:hypothetical protein
MRCAYADPPYLGCAGRLYGDHPDAAVYDTVEGHAALIARLSDEYPDGWALSLHVPSLPVLLPFCPDDCRILAWVKPWCSWKPGVTVAYAWEPVIVRGGRRRPRSDLTVRDWLAEPSSNRKFPGAKPEAFSWWLFEVLGMTPDDELADLVPGSGAVTDAWERWCERERPVAEGLFAPGGVLLREP